MLQQVLVPACPHEGYTACRGGRRDIGGFLRALIHRDLHRRIENQGARAGPAVSHAVEPALFHTDRYSRLRSRTGSAAPAAGTDDPATRSEEGRVGKEWGSRSNSRWVPIN